MCFKVAATLGELIWWKMLFQNSGFLHWSSGLMMPCFGIAKEVTQLWGSMGQCCQSEPLAWGRKRLLVILYCWCSALHSTVSEENSSLCGLAAECVICNVPYPDQMTVMAAGNMLGGKALAVQTWGLERFPESTCAGQVWHLTVISALQRQKWWPWGQFKIGRSCDLWTVGSSEKPYIKNKMESNRGRHDVSVNPPCTCAHTCIDSYGTCNTYKQKK